MELDKSLLKKLEEAKAKYGRTFRTDELSPRMAKKSDYLRKLERLSQAKQSEVGNVSVTVLQDYRKSASRQA